MKFNDDDRRFGVLYLRTDILKKEEFLAALKGAIVFRAEHIFIDNSIRYEIYCDKLRPLYVNEVIPVYDIIFKKMIHPKTGKIYYVRSFVESHYSDPSRYR